ncbi:MAG: hypothetical protein RSA86_04720 [Christensenellaceae bacterium]
MANEINLYIPMGVKTENELYGHFVDLRLLASESFCKATRHADDRRLLLCAYFS